MVSPLHEILSVDFSVWKMPTTDYTLCEWWWGSDEIT